MAFDKSASFRAFFEDGFEVFRRRRGVESPQIIMFLVRVDGAPYDLTGVAASSITVSLRCSAWGIGHILKTGQVVTIEDATMGKIGIQLISAIANDIPDNTDTYVLIVIDLEADILGTGLANPINYPVLRTEAK